MNQYLYSYNNRIVSPVAENAGKRNFSRLNVTQLYRVSQTALSYDTWVAGIKHAAFLTRLPWHPHPSHTLAYTVIVLLHSTVVQCLTVTMPSFVCGRVSTEIYPKLSSTRQATEPRMYFSVPVLYIFHFCLRLVDVSSDFSVAV